jgi:hypothetical protein
MGISDAEFENLTEVVMKFFLVGYRALWSVRAQLKFRRNMPPPTSGLKRKLKKKPA